MIKQQINYMLKSLLIIDYEDSSEGFTLQKLKLSK